MNVWSKVLLLSTSFTVSASLFTVSPALMDAPNNRKAPTTTQSKAATKLTLVNMPSNYKSSIEWVWNNRIVKEGSTNRKNLIFDQIIAGKGTLNYVVRWQSNKSVTLQQRQQIEKMLNAQLNQWNSYLAGYENWPYDSLKVKIVGWTCVNPDLILDKQPDEIVYSDYVMDDLYKVFPKVPEKLPVAPTSLSRFEHFNDPNYVYPGGADKRFDMYLWGTTNFGGGEGGDWGQRVSEDYILNSLTSDETTIIDHELGHGFGIPDFYKEEDRPPGGFPDQTIMWVGSSPKITEWDGWLLRYTWSQLKDDKERFPI